MDVVQHTLEPVYNAHSRVLILGTMPSPKSREIGFYYGHPQNRFWRALSAVMGEVIPAEPEEKRVYLLNKRIALWDVLARCEIAGASDSSIRKPVPNDINRIVHAAKIHQVFTMGKTASSLYRKYCMPDTGLTDLCLPSPSPANCRIPFDELVEAYRVIRDNLA